MSNQNYDSKIFIADYGAASHMVRSEENITSLKDIQKRVTIGNSRKLTGKHLEVGTAIRDITGKSIV